jgi:hypothetical protein
MTQAGNRKGDVESTARLATVRPRQHAETRPLRLLLLAPPHANVPRVFRNLQYHAEWHEQLLAGMQRLRGAVYVQDGAIGPRELSADGCHRIGIDWDSWHLVAIDRHGAICGCVRYRAHAATAEFHQLWVGRSALASSPIWGARFRSAVESGLQQARTRNVAYVEVGGWAIEPQRRYTTEAMQIALTTYSLARVLGGCIGITTATTRHCSSSILRRLGGSPLESMGDALPPYYDPQFQCEMEVLCFDSERPAPKYAPLVDQLQSEILDAPVICAGMPRLQVPHELDPENLPLHTQTFGQIESWFHA